MNLHKLQMKFSPAFRSINYFVTLDHSKLLNWSAQDIIYVYVYEYKCCYSPDLPCTMLPCIHLHVFMYSYSCIRLPCKSLFIMHSVYSMNNNEYTWRIKHSDSDSSSDFDRL